ncbi:unnamed protein product [Linum tenue]|uniref:Uncharacterized protein n=1 Tax=Linum tenue TaxID=586396 RepID=A0AAV0HHV8_9ROSI|nr:unnamed protein product [Linum tenue]
MNSAYVQISFFALLLVVASCDRLSTTKQNLEMSGVEGDGATNLKGGVSTAAQPVVVLCNANTDCAILVCQKGSPQCFDHHCFCTSS